MIGRLNADGSITDIAERAAGEGDIEIDTIAPRSPGDRMVADPQNPRRAIPDPAALANRAAEETLNKAIALESRARDLAALVAKGMPGAAAALVAVEAEQVAVIDAAKA